jgi:hypothetical protein
MVNREIGRKSRRAGMESLDPGYVDVSSGSCPITISNAMLNPCPLVNVARNFPFNIGGSALVDTPVLYNHFIVPFLPARLGSARCGFSWRKEPLSGCNLTPRFWKNSSGKVFQPFFL